jgi:hypothetical protein
MTDLLQVMDLVVNGPLKVHFRSKQAHSVVKYIQQWRREFTAAKTAAQPPPTFQPPPITVMDAVCTIMDVITSEFQQPNFKAGMQRSFVDVGLAPLPSGDYTQYTSHYNTKHYTKKAKPRKQVKLLQELVCDMQLKHSSKSSNKKATSE